MVISVCFKSRLGGNSGARGFTPALLLLAFGFQISFPSFIGCLVLQRAACVRACVRAEAPPPRWPSIVISHKGDSERPKCWLMKSGAGSEDELISSQLDCPRLPTHPELHTHPPSPSLSVSAGKNRLFVWALLARQKQH